MIRSIGVGGVLGLLLTLAGIGVIAYVDPLLAAGFAAILVGVALLVRDLVTSALSAFGLGGVV